MAEKAKGAQHLQRAKEPQQRKDKTGKRADQGETAIYRLKDHIKCGDKNHAHYAVEQKTINRESKRAFVGEDVLRGFGRFS